MRWWIEVEADDIGQLGGEVRIARSLECSDAMRLKLVRPPNALHRSQRNPGDAGHGAAGPVGRLVRRVGAGQRPHPRHRLGPDRRLAGFARLVTQQAVRAFGGEALLPTPHHRAADAEKSSHMPHRIAPRRRKHHPRALHVLSPMVATRGDGLQPLPIRPAHDHADCLCHARRFARSRTIGNRLNASKH